MADFRTPYISCRVCPHECGIDRRRRPSGFCGGKDTCRVAAICRHAGEEPAVSGEKGVCNVFFAHCNMRCVYCQNHEISRPYAAAREMSVAEIAAEILRLLPSCENRVGFVSPSHYVPHVIEIVDRVREAGVNPVFIYNSNGYDRPEMLRLLEGRIDVYLPDFKYSDAVLAQQLSGVNHYPQAALKAIGEMYRQKGAPLWLDENGLAESGLIIRHLVLPGWVEQSVNVLRTIAEELSVKLHLSLMSQYYPPFEIPAFPSLNRSLRADEYDKVLESFFELGFSEGWMQSPDSTHCHHPHFTGDEPFEW
ncbi:MAG: radical SAM protein [Bacteroidales bacterium]|nr:radical SAM protein [Bacteroidales bacterium]